MITKGSGTSARIAIVDNRPDLVEFLRDQLWARGYEVITAPDMVAVEAMDPAPDLVLYDFPIPVDLADLFEFIEEELQAVRA